MRDRELQLDPPTSLPPWLIDELSREQAEERARASLNIDGEVPLSPPSERSRREQGQQREGAEKAPPTVIIIPI